MHYQSGRESAVVGRFGLSPSADVVLSSKHCSVPRLIYSPRRLVILLALLGAIGVALPD